MKQHITRNFSQMNLSQFCIAVKNKTAAIAMVLMLGILFTGCKKEFPELPYNNMVNFTINDAQGKPLKGVIQNDEITIYWPPEQAVPENITPTFTLADKATAQPASGTAIPFKNTSTITVTAQDGSKLIYKLKPVINSVIPFVRTLNGVITYKTKTYMFPGDFIFAEGDYFGADTTKAKISLIAADNTLVPAVMVDANELAMMATAPTKKGNYKGFKISNGIKDAVYSINFEVVENTKPQLESPVFPEAITVNAGGEVTITGGKYLDRSTLIEMYSEKLNRRYAVTIKEKTDTKLVLTIPADYVKSEYSRLFITYAASDYYEADITVININSIFVQ